MAKNKKRRKRNRPETQSVAIAAADEGPGEDDHFRASDADEEFSKASNGGRGSGSGSGRVTATSASGAGAGGFFRVYKPGMGYYTRIVTAIGGGLILVFGAHFVNARLTAYSPAVQLGVPFVILAITGMLLFRIVGSGRKTNDFFIATEGEMKKVSWSTKREVAGSTKVVLMFTVMLAALLFVVDGLFMAFFGKIGVLKADIFKTIFGL